ncbi:MAG: OmpA family protein [Myxococcaceae bacterium]
MRRSRRLRLAQSSAPAKHERCEGDTRSDIATPLQSRSAGETPERLLLAACLLALVVLATLCVARHASALAVSRTPAPVMSSPPPATAPPPLVQVEPPVVPPAPASFRVQAELDRLLAGGSIEFQTGSATLHPDAAPLLDAIAAQLASAPELQVEVEGHTDARGDAAANQRLSQLRAQAVKAYLVGKGIAPDRIRTLGSGSSRPLVRSRTPEANQLNRRIEFRVVAPGSR